MRGGAPYRRGTRRGLLGALLLSSVVGSACASGTTTGAAATEGAAGIVISDIDTAAIGARHPTALFPTPSAAARAEVHRVVDGDTIVAVLDGGRSENVRLIGVDTPEKPGGLRPAECFGAEATAFTAALLPAGSTVLLTGGTETRDVYDRLLAYVHRASDGMLVNMALAREGYAVELPIPPNTDYADHFAVAVAAARAENLGLWAACGGADTPLEE